jgi:predicted O-methyltransferase YrrM
VTANPRTVDPDTLSPPLNIFEIDGRAGVPLHQIAWAFRVTLALHAVDKFGIAEALLEKPLTAAETARICGLDTGATEKVLIVLAALALVYRTDDDYFRLTTEGRASFAPDSPLYFGHGLAFARESLTRWDQFEAYLKTGVRMSYPTTAAQAEILVRSMHAYAVRGQAQWVARSVDLTRHRQLLDLGGAVGTYSIAFCQRFPDLSATVFDRAITKHFANEMIARFGMTGRVEFKAGDWMVDEISAGYDAVLMSNILHGDGARQRLRLQRAANAVEPGGLLIVQDFILDEDRNGPIEAAAFNLHLNANTVSTIASMIQSAGFTNVALVGRGPLDAGLLTARSPS